MAGMATTGVATTSVTMTDGASVGPLPRPHVRVWAPRRSVVDSHHPLALVWTAVDPGLGQKVPFELVSAHLSCNWTCDIKCEELESTVSAVSRVCLLSGYFSIFWHLGVDG